MRYLSRKITHGILHWANFVNIQKENVKSVNKYEKRNGL